MGKFILMADPLVSILINNYNYEPYLSAAIESALSQSYKNKEVIVVDDGSSDGSREVIDRYGERVIKVYKTNEGQASAFNEGFARSNGEIICFLDADDVFLSTKVAKVAAVMVDPAVGWCFHGLQWTDRDLIPRQGSPEIPYKSGNYDFRDQVLRGTCNYFPPATSGLVFSREFLQTLLPMPSEIRITSDNYLKLSSLALSSGYILAEPLALQRIHGSNLYTNKSDDPQRADIQLTTAMCLRNNFPAQRKCWNRMFAAGLVDKWKSGSSLAATSKILREYFTGLPLTEQSETLIRVLVRVVR